MIAGFGCRASAGVESLLDAYRRAANGQPVTALATAKDKAATPAFQALQQRLSLPLHAIDATTLEAMDTQTQSAASTKARHSGSVAEAAALAAAGPGARLLAPRAVSQDRLATCALAFTGDPT